MEGVHRIQASSKSVKIPIRGAIEDTRQRISQHDIEVKASLIDFLAGAMEEKSHIAGIRLAPTCCSSLIFLDATAGHHVRGCDSGAR